MRYTDVDDGVEYARFRTATFSGHVFRVDLARAGLRVVPAGGPTVRRKVKVISRSFSRAVAVNGSFFDEKDRAMGLVVDQGRLIARQRVKPWGALVIEDGRARIVTGRDVDLNKHPQLVIQGIPRLVIDGKAPSLKSQTARRTAVCLQAGRLALVVATTAEANAFAQFLARPEREGGLGCKDALNLDGGPSTQLSAHLGELRVDVRGGWGVPNALVAVPGLPERVPSAAKDAGRSAPLEGGPAPSSEREPL